MKQRLRPTSFHMGLLSILLGASQPAFSQLPTDSLRHELRREREENLRWKRMHAHLNPVLLQQDSLAAITWAEVGVDFDDANLYDPQWGAGASRYSFSTRSFKRLANKQSIWGNASYTRSTLRDVRWNETADVARIAPYVIADSVGGDLQQETYALSGGYNVRLGRQLLGISANYRALQMYREVDPRPNNISSDLTLRLGVASRIGKYDLAVGYDFNYYTQNNRVSTANPVSSPSFYHLIGMGMDQKLLWGKNKEVYYTESGHQISLQTQPQHVNGWYFHGYLKHAYLDKSITTLRSLMASNATTTTAAAQLGYALEIGRSLWRPFVNYSVNKRLGTSFIFDNKSTNDMQKIGELQDFTHREQYFSTGLHYQLRLNDAYALQVRPQCRYSTDALAYRTDQRSWKINNIRAESTFGLQKRDRTDNHLWDIDIGIGRRHLQHTNLELALPLDSEGLNQLVMDQYAYQSTEMICYSMLYQHYFLFSTKQIWTVALRGNYIQWHPSGGNVQAAIRLGVIL